jgi:hypothetical protein
MPIKFQLMKKSWGIIFFENNELQRAFWQEQLLPNLRRRFHNQFFKKASKSRENTKIPITFDVYFMKSMKIEQ